MTASCDYDRRFAHNKIVFTPLLLIEVIMPKNESDRSGICMLEALILSL